MSTIYNRWADDLDVAKAFVSSSAYFVYFDEEEDGNIVAIFYEEDKVIRLEWRGMNVEAFMDFCEEHA